MIEVEISKTGLPVLKSEGRFLHSSYDPLAEAQAWLKDVSKKVSDYDFVILLGAGNPYHFSAFRRKFSRKKILIVEIDEQLLSKAGELVNEVNIANVVHLNEARELHTIGQILEFSKEIFCTLRMPSTRFYSKAFFDEIETALTGRVGYDFERFCEARPNLEPQIDSTSLVSQNLITVKDISSAFVDQNQQLSPEQRVFKILEELVR